MQKTPKQAFPIVFPRHYTVAMPDLVIPCRRGLERREIRNHVTDNAFIQGQVNFAVPVMRPQPLPQAVIRLQVGLLVFWTKAQTVYVPLAPEAH